MANKKTPEVIRSFLKISETILRLFLAFFANLKFKSQINYPQITTLRYALKVVICGAQRKI